MSPELRRDLRKIILCGVGLFLVLNAFSWQPGYGGRSDKEPGMEVERFFGWPACFYCDLWRSDRPHEVDHWEYVSPIPVTSEMYFVYFSHSLVALLLNVVIVTCGMVVWFLFKLVERRRQIENWMLVVGIALLAVAALIVEFGSKASAFL
jgi:hypothetical protein